MKGSDWRGLLLGCLLTFVIGLVAVAGNTYITDLDPDVDVTEPDCYSFDITVDQASGTAATLTLRVRDVDEEEGEIDIVSINGHELGHLSGTNEQWSTTSFDISSYVVYGGSNTVQVCVDPDGGESNTWVATIDWGQILVDGGSASDADIVSLSADGTWNAIDVTTEVSATNTDTYRLEINLLDSTGNNKDIAVDTFSLSGGSSTTRYNTVSLPSEPTETETFTIEADLFNDTTGVQQAIETTTWTYVAEHPPVVSDIPDQTVPEGGTFAAIYLDDYVTDPDNSDAEMTWTYSGNVQLSVSIGAGRVATVTIPDPDWNGSETITFKATDPGGLSDSDAATFTVTPVNDPPVADDGSLTTSEDVAASITLAASDIEDGTPVFTSHTEPAHGTLSGTMPHLTYTPAPNYCGGDSFEFTVTDSGGLTDTGTVSIEVSCVNDPPVAVDDAAGVTEGSTVDVDVLANDSDVDGDALHIASVTDPAKGTAAIVSGDRIRYVPDYGACGNDTFSYVVEDGNGGSDSASVAIVIENLPPTAGDDSASTQEDAAVLIDVLANDSDPGSDVVISSVGAAAHGTAVAVGGSIRYTPHPRFEGEDRFSYTISDSCGATVTASVQVEVLHTNHPPQANAGVMYKGVVGEPLALDGSFSSDPDVEDTLQYRWDIDGDGEFDTDWSNDPRYTATYSEAFFGELTLEVRDLYRGLPSGEVSRATVLVRIVSVQSLQVYVFDDVDGNGVMDDGELGIPGVEIVAAGKTLVTQLDGGINVPLDPGSYDVSIDDAAVSRLRSRGYALGVTEADVVLKADSIGTVYFAAVKTSTKIVGFVYVDLDENGEYDEDEDQLVQGLRVILDDDRETLTDDSGRFFFLKVLFGDHTLWIGENKGDKKKEDLLSTSVSITLERGKSGEFAVIWPWEDTGPKKGFLEVEVEKQGKK